MKVAISVGILVLVLSPSIYAQQQVVPLGKEVVVTATRFPQVLSNEPVNMTVLTREQIAQSPAVSLPELLAQQAGVHLRNSDGSPNSSIDLRGFGISGTQNTLILLDGQRLNDIDLSTIKWSAIPLSEVERVEIMRGSGAVLYGEGATGGTINIITKKAGGAPAGNVNVMVGNYNTWAVQGGFTAGSKEFSLHVQGQDYDSDNYRLNNRDKERNVSADARWITDIGNFSLALGADQQTLRLPGVRKVNATTGVNQLANDRRGTDTPKDYSSRDGDHATLGYNRNFGDAEVIVEYANRNKQTKAFFGDYPSGAFDSYIKTNLRVNSVSPRVKLPNHLFGIANSLVVGVDYAEWDYDSRRAASATAIATAPAAIVLARQRSQGVYVQDNAQLSSSTTMTLGGRIQGMSTRARDTVNPAAYATGSQERTSNAYEFGLRQKLGGSTSLYGKIGRSFRFATVDEIYSQFGSPAFDSIITLLEPQASFDREVGVEYREGRNSMRASLYRMDLTNELHYNALTFTNMNLSPTRRYGAELEGSWGITKALEVGANYTYTIAKFVEGVYAGTNVSGKDIPLVPKHAATLTAAYRFTPSTQLTGALNYVGQQRFDNDQANTFNQKIPAYTTVDLKLTHKLAQWTFAGTVNNLFNEKYYTYGIRGAAQGTYNAYPMRERYLLFSTQYDF